MIPSMVAFIRILAFINFELEWNILCLLHMDVDIAYSSWILGVHIRYVNNHLKILNLLNRHQTLLRLVKPS